MADLAEARAMWEEQDWREFHANLRDVAATWSVVAGLVIMVVAIGAAL
jgi:hypothetical protein